MYTKMIDHMLNIRQAIRNMSYNDSDVDADEISIISDRELTPAVGIGGSSGKKRRRSPASAAVAAGDATVPIHRTYRIDDIAEAHADMEAGRATGKLVVLP